MVPSTIGRRSVGGGPYYWLNMLHELQAQMQAQVNAVTFEVGTLLNLMALTVSGSAVVISTKMGLREVRAQIVELKNHFNEELHTIREEYRDVVHRYGPLMTEIQKDIAILKTNDARRTRLEDSRGELAIGKDHK